MASAFSKEERVAFEDLLVGFEDAQVLSKVVSKYSVPAGQMERSGDTIWRPQPYIMQSFDGTDQTPNFVEATQLSVPATLGYQKAVPWQMSATELRDALQEGRLGQAAKQKLASDINLALLTVASQQGTIVHVKSTAASGYADIAAAEALCNELGVPMDNRVLCLSSRDYNNLAADLAGRGTLSGKPLTAYERSYIGPVAGFDTFKLDYAITLPAHDPDVTGSVNGANQYHTPAATSTAASGETSNVDNRTQNLAVTITAGTMAVGDCFTIADVYAVHPITKESTGQLKTFRVRAIVSGAGGTGTITISPPIISGGGATDAELMYQNVDSTPVNTATLNFLNVSNTARAANPFFHRDALEILVGGYAVPSDAGVAVMQGSTSQGLQVVMQKQYDIATMQTRFRIDCMFGVCLKQPEMAGVISFSQA